MGAELIQYVIPFSMRMRADFRFEAPNTRSAIVTAAANASEILDASMSICVLPPVIRSRLRSGVAVTNPRQCVEELVLNALDAAATCVAVRVDLQYLKIQVVDNGCGMNLLQLKMVGERYATSKCHLVEDLNNLAHYGYRGEALASIRNMSNVLEIVSRPASSETTYSKIFNHGKTISVSKASQSRPSFGTTITVHDFMYNLPVRRKHVHEVLDFEEIRQRLESIALIHPEVSFSLRNDVTNYKCLQTMKSVSVLTAFSHLFGKERAETLRPVSHTIGSLEIEGYISTGSHHNKSLQFFYINKRLILKTKLHKVINASFSKSVLAKNRGRRGSPVNQPASPYRPGEKYAIFVLNVACPLTDYDICLEPSKTLVEFKEWDLVITCMQETIDMFLQKYICSEVPVAPRGPESTWTSDRSEANAQTSVSFGRAIEVHNVKCSLHSLPAKRVCESEGVLSAIHCVNTVQYKVRPAVVHHNRTCELEAVVTEYNSNKRRCLQEKTRHEIHTDSCKDARNKCQPLSLKSAECITTSYSTFKSLVSDEKRVLKPAEALLECSRSNEKLVCKSFRLFQNFLRSEDKGSVEEGDECDEMKTPLNQMLMNPFDVHKNVPAQRDAIVFERRRHTASSNKRPATKLAKKKLAGEVISGLQKFSFDLRNKEPHKYALRNQALDKAVQTSGSLIGQPIAATEHVGALAKTVSMVTHVEPYLKQTTRMELQLKPSNKLSENDEIEKSARAKSFLQILPLSACNKMVPDASKTFQHFDTSESMINVLQNVAATSVIHNTREEVNTGMNRCNNNNKILSLRTVLPASNQCTRKVDQLPSTPNNKSTVTIYSNQFDAPGIPNTNYCSSLRIAEKSNRTCVQTNTDLLTEKSNAFDRRSFDFFSAEQLLIQCRSLLSQNERDTQPTTDVAEMNEENITATSVCSTQPFFVEENLSERGSAMEDVEVCDTGPFETTSTDLLPLKNDKGTFQLDPSCSNYDQTIYEDKLTPLYRMMEEEQHPHKCSVTHTLFPEMNCGSDRGVNKRCNKNVLKESCIREVVHEDNSDTSSFDLISSVIPDVLGKIERINSVFETPLSQIQSRQKVLDWELTEANSFTTLERNGFVETAPLSSNLSSVLRSNDLTNFSECPNGISDIGKLQIIDLVPDSDNSAIDILISNSGNETVLHIEDTSCSKKSTIAVNYFTENNTPNMQDKKIALETSFDGYAEVGSGMEGKKGNSASAVLINKNVRTKVLTSEDKCTEHEDLQLVKDSRNTDNNEKPCESQVALRPPNLNEAITETEGVEEPCKKSQWMFRIHGETGRKVYIHQATGCSTYECPPTDAHFYRSSNVGHETATLLGPIAVPFHVGSDGVKACRGNVRSTSLFSIEGVCLDDLDMVDDHIKWRNISDADFERQDVVQMLEQWENPVFKKMKEDVCNASLDGSLRPTVKVYNMLHPYKFNKQFLKKCEVLNQVDNKFIACLMDIDSQSTHSESRLLVLFDQHAVHERIRLEQLQEDIKDTTNSKLGEYCVRSYSLDPPLELTLDPAEVRVLSSFLPTILRWGIKLTVNQSKRTRVYIHTLPTFLLEREVNELKRKRSSVAVPLVEQIIRDIVDMLQTTGCASSTLPKTLNHILWSQACHGAVKFGDHLEMTQCYKLIQLLKDCKLPFQCAHGRPTVVPLLDMQLLNKYSVNEVKKKPQLWKLAAKVKQEK